MLHLGHGHWDPLRPFLFLRHPSLRNRMSGLVRSKAWSYWKWVNMFFWIRTNSNNLNLPVENQKHNKAKTDFTLFICHNLCFDTLVYLCFRWLNSSKRRGNKKLEGIRRHIITQHEVRDSSRCWLCMWCLILTRIPCFLSHVTHEHFGPMNYLSGLGVSKTIFCSQRTNISIHSSSTNICSLINEQFTTAQHLSL